jgi:hypothetical protein
VRVPGKSVRARQTRRIIAAAPVAQLQKVSLMDGALVHHGPFY